MTDAEKLPEWIDRYNRNELHGKELKQFLAMVKKNPQLKKEVQLDKEINEILSENEIISLRKKIAKVKEREDDRKTRLMIYLLAACAVVFLGMTIYYFIQFNEARKKLIEPIQLYSLTDTSYMLKKEELKPNQIEIDKATIDSALARESRGDSSIRKQVRAMFATNYTPYPPFESLTGEIFRSGFFNLLLPTSTDSFSQGKNITFSWDTDSPKAITLEIADNYGFPMYQSGELNVKTLTIKSLKLTPGLYYFKFIENDDIVYFGKFYIR